MHDKKFTLDDFDFDLPEDLVAQYPSDKRGESKLFRLNRSTESFEDRYFYELPSILKAGDVLVMNDAKVIPARLYFRKETGSEIEVVLARKLDGNDWLVLTNRTKKLKEGSEIFSVVDPSYSFTVKGRVDDYLKVTSNVDFSEEILDKIGNIPLPPYIKRKPLTMDKERYQTVFASKPGAVAAPTAGLHFTEAIMGELDRKGVEILHTTLDVSWGTFSPVRDSEIEKHKMHSERYHLSDEVASKINRARSEGRRIIAVGTTSLRVLESTFRDGKNVPGTGETDIFIYPPYKIKSIDAMITNFHTPKSTLLMLISAFAGYDFVMKAYKTAVERKYRFYSYGDSMLIE